MVLATTNRPSELDEAILRRLPQAFEIGIPVQRERAEILKVVLKGEKIESNTVLNDLIDFVHSCTEIPVCKQNITIPIYIGSNWKDLRN